MRKPVFDPIEFLSALNWDEMPKEGNRYCQELKEVFTGDDEAAKINLWKKMCIWSGVVRAILTEGMDH